MCIRDRLKETAEIVMAVSGETPEKTVEYFQGNDSMRLRLTYISRSGEVLADSHHEQYIMENHSERPEIQQAFRDGLGSDIRKSATDGQRYLYTAVRCGGGDVLRLSLIHS